MADAGENKVLSNEEIYQSTQDVLSEAMDNLQQENEYSAPTPPTFEEAQESQEEEKVEASSESEPEKQDELPEPEIKPGETESVESKEVKLSEEDNEFLGNLKPKAQDRFKELVARASEAAAKIADYETGHQVFEHIAESTTNPDQLNWALGVFKSLNSGDYDAAREGLKELDKFSDQVAQKLGLNSTSQNEPSTYGDFTDLSKAVEDLDMSEEWANKLAQERSNTNARVQARSEFEQDNVRAQEYQTWYNNEAEKAYKSIQEWEAGIVDSDPDYMLKKEIMMDVGAKIANSDTKPSDWLGTLKSEYDILSRGMTAASSKIPNASKNSGPLAPSGNSGSQGSSGYLDTPEVTPEFLQAHLDQMHS